MTVLLFFENQFFPTLPQVKKKDVLFSTFKFRKTYCDILPQHGYPISKYENVGITQISWGRDGRNYATLTLI